MSASITGNNAVTPALPADTIESSMADRNRTSGEESFDSTDKESFDRSDASEGNDVPDIPPLAAEGRPPSRLIDVIFPKLRRKNTVADLDAIATQRSVFDDAQFAKQYTPHPKWENWSRFDPRYRWTWRQEKALVRRLDLSVCIVAVVMFFALDLDRVNISQANSDGFLADIGASTDDYNLGNTLFKVGFLVAELPSQMVSKRVGADVWIPCQLVIFSILSGAQYWMNNRSAFFAFRFLIGFFQGGFIPDSVLWLSYYYTKSELPLRLAYFWVSNYLATIASPFLALGLLQIKNENGSWRWLFLIEGLITLVVGILAFFHMPPSPTQTKNLLYPKGWYNEEEEKILVNRIIRDDPSKGSMHNRQGINWQNFKRSLLDYDIWPLYAIGCVFLIPSYPVSNYLTLQLKHLGFTTTETNALSAPAPAIGLVNLIIITIISELVDNRSFVAMSMSVWNFVCYLALYKLPGNKSPWIYWAVATVQQAYPYVHPLQVAWISRNSGSVRTRTISAAVYNMLVQVSSIIGANVYQSSDAPLYRKGNLAMWILSLGVCFLYVFTYWYYKRQNRIREGKWSAMTKEEQLHYLATTRDEGNRRLDWRFAY